jgi:hypothetical protein
MLIAPSELGPQKFKIMPVDGDVLGNRLARESSFAKHDFKSISIA